MCTWTSRTRLGMARSGCANGRSSARASVIVERGARALRRARLPRDDGRRDRRRGRRLGAHGLHVLPDEGGHPLQRPRGFPRPARRRARAAAAPGASALDTLRDFVVENLGAMDESSRVRWEIVSHDEHLLSHQRARQVRARRRHRGGRADELGEDADDFRLQLVTATVVAAVMAVYEHRASARSQHRVARAGAGRDRRGDRVPARRPRGDPRVPEAVLAASSRSARPARRGGRARRR